MRFWLIAGGVLLIDQLSKYLVIQRLEIGQSIPLIGHWLYLTHVHNPGAAFGILAGKSWFFLVSALMVIVIMTIYNSRYSPSGIMQLAMGLIAGGAIGNFIDRMRYSLVIDFFDLGWWPVFNVADMAIVGGGILFAICLLMKDQSEVN